MKKMTEAYFIPHCDDWSCDLGSFQYECPCCGNVHNDYNIWWKQNNLYSGETIYFNCKTCNKELKVSYNSEEFEFYIYSV